MIRLALYMYIYVHFVLCSPYNISDQRSSHLDEQTRSTVPDEDANDEYPEEVYGGDVLYR